MADSGLVQACKTPEDALADAMVSALDAPREHTLSEVMFGRHADGSGWWWTLRWHYETASLLNARPADTTKARMRMITAAWAADRARYDGGGEDGSGG